MSWRDAVAGLPVAQTTAEHYPYRPWWADLYGYFSSAGFRSQFIELKIDVIRSLTKVLEQNPLTLDAKLLLGAMDRAAIITGAYDPAALPPPRRQNAPLEPTGTGGDAVGRHSAPPGDRFQSPVSGALED